jgi:hypothetical protein
MYLPMRTMWPRPSPFVLITAITFRRTAQPVQLPAVQRLLPYITATPISSQPIPVDASPRVVFGLRTELAFFFLHKM